MVRAATLKWTRTRSRTAVAPLVTTVAVTSTVTFLFRECVASAATWFARFAGAISGWWTWSGSVSMSWVRSIASWMLASCITTSFTAGATAAPIRMFMFVAVMTLWHMRCFLYWIWTIFTGIDTIGIDSVWRLMTSGRRAQRSHGIGHIVNESFSIAESATFTIVFATCERTKRRNFWNKNCVPVYTRATIEILFSIFEQGKSRILLILCVCVKNYFFFFGWDNHG